MSPLYEVVDLRGLDTAAMRDSSIISCLRHFVFGMGKQIFVCDLEATMITDSKIILCLRYSVFGIRAHN
jgi:hypothetical protein